MNTLDLTPNSFPFCFDLISNFHYNLLLIYSNSLRTVKILIDCLWLYTVNI